MCEYGVHAVFCLVVELTNVWSVSASPCLPSVTLDITAERERIKMKPLLGSVECDMVYSVRLLQLLTLLLLQGDYLQSAVCPHGSVAGRLVCYLLGGHFPHIEVHHQLPFSPGSDSCSLAAKLTRLLHTRLWTE